jgi:hypothetical protein
MKRTAYFLVLVLFLATTSMVLADGNDGGDDLAYVVSSTAQFGVVNPETGDFRLIGNTPNVLSGLARGPHHKIYGLDANNTLVTIDPANATLTPVGNTGLSVQPNGNVTLLTSLGKRKLYAVDPNNDLYSINRSTGIAKKIGSTGIPVPDFNACVSANSLTGAEGFLYFTWEVDDLGGCQSVTASVLYRINPYTGEATLVGATGADTPIVGSGRIDDTLYGFSFGLPVGQPNKIYAIDLESGQATFVTIQGSNLDSVFGAIPLSSHHSRHERED